MSLPLLTRAAEDGVVYVLTPRSRTHRGESEPAPRREVLPLDARVPHRRPGAGEQYRFHFDMGKCVACKCCVVACNEQNGNPAAINWRRVGELEGGLYPATRRSYLSMGCNHCLEPTCLQGCPVDAYSKDAETGIVRHSADTCIGCQYCTWNCSYGVPQYNPERGVVGKCDMCHGRLSLGQSPACVTACPQGAIQIEIVEIAQWRGLLARQALGKGAPADDGSLSATRVTMPAHLPHDIKALEPARPSPEHPHWPLVIMTVLTQLSVGAFGTIWWLQMLGTSARLDLTALASLVVAGLALTASTIHLGRPIHAYRALKMWRRSWISREVLLFTAFAGVAGFYAAQLWLELPGAAWVGALTLLIGIAGVTASACIYRVPARPAWNTRLTPLQFLLTGATLGPLFAWAIGAGGGPWFSAATAAMAGAQLVLLAVRFVRLTASDSIELRGTARLLSTVFASRLVARGVLLAVGGVVLPLAGGNWAVAAAALVVATAGELLGRYLFFVSVVPKHMTTPYLPMGSEAA